MYYLQVSQILLQLTINSNPKLIVLVREEDSKMTSLIMSCYPNSFQLRLAFNCRKSLPVFFSCMRVRKLECPRIHFFLFAGNDRINDTNYVGGRNTWVNKILRPQLMDGMKLMMLLKKSLIPRGRNSHLQVSEWVLYAEWNGIDLSQKSGFEDFWFNECLDWACGEVLYFDSENYIALLCILCSTVECTTIPRRGVWGGWKKN